MNFAILRELREDRAWSQTKAAAECGISQQYYAALEAGRKPLTESVLVKIAYGFGLTVQRLREMLAPKAKRRRTAA